MKLVIGLLAALSASAQAPLPGLRIEPTGGGSVIFVRNVYSQPLTAFHLELVDYPGSFFWYSQDDAASEGIPAGVEKRIPVKNMLIGAAPEYVKMQAALYADGGSAGIPEKIAQLIAQRSLTLKTTRELIDRIEKAQSSGASKAGLIAGLKQWAASIQPDGPGSLNSQTANNRNVARTMVSVAIGRIDESSAETALNGLRKPARPLATSKPDLEPA